MGQREENHLWAISNVAAIGTGSCPGHNRLKWSLQRELPSQVSRQTSAFLFSPFLLIHLTQKWPEKSSEALPKTELGGRTPTSCCWQSRATGVLLEISARCRDDALQRSSVIRTQCDFSKIRKNSERTPCQPSIRTPVILAAGCLFECALPPARAVSESVRFGQTGLNCAKIHFTPVGGCGLRKEPLSWMRLVIAKHKQATVKNFFLERYNPGAQSHHSNMGSRCAFTKTLLATLKKRSLNKLVSIFSKLPAVIAFVKDADGNCYLQQGSRLQAPTSDSSIHEPQESTLWRYPAEQWNK